MSNDNVPVVPTIGDKVSIVREYNVTGINKIGDEIYAHLESKDRIESLTVNIRALILKG